MINPYTLKGNLSKNGEVTKSTKGETPMKRTTIYINGVKASMYDISVLLQHLDDITDIKVLDNGNISVKTV